MLWWRFIREGLDPLPEDQPKDSRHLSCLAARSGLSAFSNNPGTLWVNGREISSDTVKFLIDAGVCPACVELAYAGVGHWELRSHDVNCRKWEAL